MLSTWSATVFRMPSRSKTRSSMKSRNRSPAADWTMALIRFQP